MEARIWQGSPGIVLGGGDCQTGSEGGERLGGGELGGGEAGWDERAEMLHPADGRGH